MAILHLPAFQSAAGLRNRARLASLLGAIALSLVAMAFARMGEWAQATFLRLVESAPLAPLVVTPAIFVVTVWATRRWWPEASGSGIPQVMAATHSPRRPGRLLALPVAAAKFGATIVLLLSGASAGREGPTVQISAAIMVAVHRALRVPVTAGIMIAGGAAGVAAAFNTPLAGVAFAIEELASAFEQKVALLVMVTVMIAGLISLGLAGDYVYFGAMSEGLPLRLALIFAPLAGVAGGIVGGIFAKALVTMAWSEARWIKAIRGRPLLWAGTCGLIVAIAGIASHGLSWGTGYETTRALLSGETRPQIFGPAKFVATLATALSGAPGGIFAPSLSVGAGLGQLLGLLAPHGPGAPDSAGAIALLGLIGTFAGVVRAPLTAIIIVSEMTADRGMILPLFATALIADAISAQVSPEKLYHALSRKFRRDPGT